MHLPGPESRLSRSRSRCRVTCEARELRQGGGCRGGIQGNSDGDRSNNLQAQLVGRRLVVKFPKELDDVSCKASRRNAAAAAPRRRRKITDGTGTGVDILKEWQQTGGTGRLTLQTMIC